MELYGKPTIPNQPIVWWNDYNDTGTTFFERCMFVIGFPPLVFVPLYQCNKEYCLQIRSAETGPRYVLHHYLVAATAVFESVAEDVSSSSPPPPLAPDWTAGCTCSYTGRHIHRKTTIIKRTTFCNIFPLIA